MDPKEVAAALTSVLRGRGIRFPPAKFAASAGYEGAVKWWFCESGRRLDYLVMTEFPLTPDRPRGSKRRRTRYVDCVWGENSAGLPIALAMEHESEGSITRDGKVKPEAKIVEEAEKLARAFPRGDVAKVLVYYPFHDPQYSGVLEGEVGSVYDYLEQTLGPLDGSLWILTMSQPDGKGALLIGSEGIRVPPFLSISLWSDRKTPIPVTPSSGETFGMDELIGLRADVGRHVD